MPKPLAGLFPTTMQMAENWQQIIDRVSNLQRDIARVGSIAWFRGQRNSIWTLQSSLHRHIQKLISETGVSFSAVESKALVRDVYKNLFQQFQTDAWSLLAAGERSDWGLVFSMQHYGIPTRLLDWTESFLCAVYFSHLTRSPGEEAAVFVLDPQKLNLKSIGIDGLIHLSDAAELARVNLNYWHPKYVPPENDLLTVAIAPVYTNPRLLSQRSGFTVGGDSFVPLEQEFAEINAIEKIILPADTFSDIEKYIELAGVNAFNFYPDLEGLRLKHEANTRKTIKDAREALSKTRKDRLTRG
jgi:hypothetical protein